MAFDKKTISGQGIQKPRIMSSGKVSTEARGWGQGDMPANIECEELVRN